MLLIAFIGLHSQSYGAQTWPCNVGTSAKVRQDMLEIPLELFSTLDRQRAISYLLGANRRHLPHEVFACPPELIWPPGDLRSGVTALGDCAHVLERTS
ncbi:uncharacterized protein CC84DRAFT_863390 [Paraphaeosphaeria sporulosa]|uniref:Uncharacterized protein n=1 Tax=Paraphaeosphaeria sporulosa TaxID=1460663 RepID=A0A177CAA7_9PLEO|nr:uncharacterized protein CC84DRAFT_863390 [Paraphaeosphaeria sporulosa]OAG03697.1 hypothetical protein CC84DRAFT_863390 [Paraphaeosphaeria sporulosa]